MKAIGRADQGLEVNHFLIDNSDEMKFVGMVPKILIDALFCLLHIYALSMFILNLSISVIIEALTIHLVGIMLFG